MRNKIILLLVVISLSFAISSCKKKIELKDCPITHELEFKDSVNINFSNGYEMNDIPY